MKKDDILKTQPTATSRSFRYKMKRAQYYQDFGKAKRRPGVIATSVGWLIRVLPKVGPLKALKLKAPGAEAEKIFIQSFDTSLAAATTAMRKLHNSGLALPNIDYDTGKETARGEYDMADLNFDNLLLKLSDNDFRHLDAALKKQLLSFYTSSPPKHVTKINRKHCDKVNLALSRLKLANPL
jgi:hypothetical protein